MHRNIAGRLNVVICLEKLNRFSMTSLRHLISFTGNSSFQVFKMNTKPLPPPKKKQSEKMNNK